MRAPAEDQRVNVTAKLGVPRPGAYSPATGGKPAPPPGGAITLRFQPLSDNPYTFCEQAGSGGQGGSAAAWHQREAGGSGHSLKVAWKAGNSACMVSPS